MKNSLLIMFLFSSIGFAHTMKTKLTPKRLPGEAQNSGEEHFYKCEIQNASFTLNDNDEYIVDYIEFKSGLVIYANDDVDDVDQDIFSLLNPITRKKGSDHPTIIEKKEMLKSLKRKSIHARGGCSGGG